MILRAIGLMILAMATMALGDMTIKLASRHASQGQIMVMLSLGGVVFFVILARLRGVKLHLAHMLHPLVLLRSLCEITATIGMIMAISLIDLSMLAAILQSTPLIVTLGAALFLGETVGWRRWVAVAIGLMGMLIVIRPFGAAFTGYEFFAVMGAFGLAARDLMNRIAPPFVHTIELSTYGFLATLLPGIVLVSTTSQPIVLQANVVWPMLAAIAATTIGYLSITNATRMAPAAIVAPFRYSRLIFTAGLGMLVFGERPDLWTYLGSALILAAGLYAIFRERQLAKANAAG